MGTNRHNGDRRHNEDISTQWGHIDTMGTCARTKHHAVEKAHRRWKRRAPRSGGGPGGGAPWFAIWTFYMTVISKIQEHWQDEPRQPTVLLPTNEQLIRASDLCVRLLELNRHNGERNEGVPGFFARRRLSPHLSLAACRCSLRGPDRGSLTFRRGWGVLTVRHLEV